MDRNLLCSGEMDLQLHTANKWLGRIRMKRQGHDCHVIIRASPISFHNMEKQRIGKSLGRNALPEMLLSPGHQIDWREVGPASGVWDAVGEKHDINAGLHRDLVD